MMQKVNIQFRDIDSVRTFVNIINRFDGEFDLGRGNRLVDAKSIIGICSCDLSRPVELLIHSDDRRYWMHCKGTLCRKNLDI